MSTDTFIKKSLFYEQLNLLNIIDDNFISSRSTGKMSALVRKARQVIQEGDEQQKITQLLDLVYYHWGFNHGVGFSFSSEHLFIDRVLDTKEGMPTALASIVLYLAGSLGLPLYAVNFPTQLVLRAELPTAFNRKKLWFINPADGSTLTEADLEKWIEGEFGFDAHLERRLLDIATPEDLAQRLEMIFKLTLTREGRYEEALKIIEWRLNTQPDDPYQIRDRGMVLASLDCFQAAIDDFDYFIHQCPDDPSVKMLKLEIKALEKETKRYAIH